MAGRAQPGGNAVFDIRRQKRLKSRAVQFIFDESDLAAVFSLFGKRGGQSFAASLDSIARRGGFKRVSP
jgi:hypothetical protein